MTDEAKKGRSPRRSKGRDFRSRRSERGNN